MKRQFPYVMGRSGRAGRGFTLVELMATMTALAVVGSAAGPMVTTTIANNRAFSVQAELAASLALARTEAARRNVPVLVSATAPRTGNEYGGGWQLWADLDGNGNRSDDEPVLRSHEALDANMVLAGPTAITYMPTGFLATGDEVQLRVCAPHAAQSYTVTVQPNGLADVASVDTACS